MQDHDLTLALDILTGRGETWAQSNGVRRHIEASLRDALPWIRQRSVQALGLARRRTLGEPQPEPAIKVYVDEKRPSAGLEAPIPDRLRLPGLDAVIPIDVEAIGTLRPQQGPCTGGTKIYNKKTPNVGGTLGCLLQKRGSPNRRYLLSNAHVIASSRDVRAGDEIARADSDEPIANLTTWSRTTPPRVKVDAAIAEVIDGKVEPLIEGRNGTRLATGTSNTIYEGMPVQLGKSGRLSGVVTDSNFRLPEELPAGANFRTWLGLSFSDQISCSRISQNGDSGSVVLSNDEALVGLLIWGSDKRSVFSRIADVLAEFQAFDVEPVTGRNLNPPVAPPDSPSETLEGFTEPDPAPSSGDAILAGRPPAVVDRDDAIDILARTIWGEARGEGPDGRKAVAAVVVNRVKRPRWWGRTVEAVCLKPWQFSCWNENDPNRAPLLSVGPSDAEFRACLAIATAAVDGFADDRTLGATHYFRTGTSVPHWAAGKTACATIGNHSFFNDIE